MNGIFCMHQEPTEEAFTLCQLRDMLLKGREARGPDKWSVNLHVGCPSGGKPIGLFHTHPGGEPEPSAQDIFEAKRLGMHFLCVSVPEKDKTKCHRL